MDQRTEAIFESITIHYIKTAEPIGSRALSKMLKTKLSAATIRNVMADLSEMGLIEQPHTSAGRIPTDHGYRFYINKLLHMKKKEVKEYATGFVTLENTQASRLEDILLDAAKELSSITDCTGLIISPKLSASRLKNIQLIRLSNRQLLTIIITQIGMVHNKVVHLRTCPDQETLNKMAEILNNLFEGNRISKIRKTLVKKLSNKKDEYDQVLAQAIRLGKKAFDIETPGELFIQGRSKLCSFPEFNNQERLKDIYKVFEDKSILTNILISAMDNNDIQIKIGNENQHLALNQCSVVAGTYGSQDYLLGSIGIVGPTRLNYRKIISAIDYSSQKLSFSLGRFLDNS